MSNYCTKLTSLLLFICVCTKAVTQDSSNITIPTISLQFPEKVAQKAKALERKLDEKSERVLQQMQKLESKLKAKLMKIDSTAAGQVFANAEHHYNTLMQRLDRVVPGQYIPKLDTLLTSLKFLKSNPEWLSGANEVKGKIKDALEKVEGLKDQFAKAEEIRQFLKERKRFLTQQLGKFGFIRELKKLNKQVYYFGQQINEYREILKDPNKIEQKAIELLTKTELFKDFMRRNGQLASLFPMPAGGLAALPTQTGFAGLQTRVQVTGFMQQAGMNLPAVSSQFRQQVTSAQSQLNELRNKISQLTGGGSADLDMPDFKPNSQKTKSFFKRLEFGLSLQSQKAITFFPSSSDIGLTVGYKLNDKSVIGIGASYKMGLGDSWSHIRLSHEGVGLRSFVDWKLKESLWISGGYEQNFLASFNRITELRDLNAWQQSGLLGISKVISLKTKFLKKTKFQLLWDFLSYRQIPRTQPILIRFGYNF